MQNSCLKTSAWWSRSSHCVENGYLSLRFPNMVKVNIHEHWTRVTRFNPLWVSDFTNKEYCIPMHFFPSPEYPGLQVQLYDPLLLLQTAFTSQVWDLFLHSSTSNDGGNKNNICSQWILTKTTNYMRCALILAMRGFVLGDSKVWKCVWNKIN